MPVLFKNIPGNFANVFCVVFFVQKNLLLIKVNQHPNEGDIICVIILYSRIHRDVFTWTPYTISMSMPNTNEGFAFQQQITLSTNLHMKHVTISHFHSNSFSNFDMTPNPTSGWNSKMYIRIVLFAIKMSSYLQPRDATDAISRSSPAHRNRHFITDH